MPRIVGPWFAGTFDNDRAAARAAVDALNLVFPTVEKVQGVRRTFQRAILEFCRDAALHETVKTLSDERAVSTDDAEATYGRVVATTLSVVGSLINELSANDQAKEEIIYEELFSDSKLWAFAHHSDAGVRRSVHKLVLTCLEKHPSLVEDNAKAVSDAYVYKSLQSDQTGSATEFMQTLKTLTTLLPLLWTDAYSGKKPALSRLRHSLKQGSQSGSSSFWKSLDEMLRKLPKQVMPTTPDGIMDLLSAARTGVSKRDERLNASSAWSTYFTFADMVTSDLEDTEAESILDAHVMPAVRQYLNPVPETADWSIAGTKAASIVAKAATVRKLGPLIYREWPSFVDKVLDTAKMSQPEQSKDYDRSQRAVAADGERLADLQRELHAASLNTLQNLTQTFAQADAKLLSECVSLLMARSGKPWGSAAIIGQLLRTSPNHFLADEHVCNCLRRFLQDDVPRIIFSPSSRYLITCLYATKNEPWFSQVFSGVLNGVLNANEPSESKLNVLRTIFTNDTPADAVKTAREAPNLQDFVTNSFNTSSFEIATTLFAELMKVEAVTTTTVDTVLCTLTASLSETDRSVAGLSAFELLVYTSNDTVKAFMARPDGPGEQLLPSVLRLEQSPDDRVAEKATVLSASLSSVVGETSFDARYSILLQQLERVSIESLPIDAVHDLTARILGPVDTLANAADVLPSLQLWLSSLRTTMKAPKPSLALLSPLGGAVHLVHAEVNEASHEVLYDSEGFSQALRIGIYVSRLLSTTDLMHKLNEQHGLIAALLYICTLLAEDNLSISGANGLWKKDSRLESEAAVLEFINEANDVLGVYWGTLGPNLRNSRSREHSSFFAALEQLQDDQPASAALSYYAALSSARAHAFIFDIRGFTAEQVKTSEELLKRWRTAKQPIPLVSCIAGFGQCLSGTSTLTRFCNELVAELTELDLAEDEYKGLELLVLLNAIFHTQEDAVTSVAKQRLIFLVKHMLPWLEGNCAVVVKGEVCKSLITLLPALHDMYGEHWEQVLSFLVSYWTTVTKSDGGGTPDEEGILLTNASLKLLGTLKKLTTSVEPNDDLVDAMKDKQEQIRAGLLLLLISANGISDDTHQPLMITYELLARHIASLPYKAYGELEDLYPLIYAPSRPIEQAAFDLLHKQIPAAQEEISLEAALDNKTAQLPDELLSLIVEAPTLDSLAEAPFDRAMPLSLQGYLYSWRLVFDHFDGSSHRVRSDYIEQLKDGAYLSGLLSFTFDFLGHSRGRPVDASKFDLQEYVADTEPTPEKDVQWLLCHLYYLTLTHLPSLVKSYYLNIRSRQTLLAVEAWTAKYISPLIIAASLQAVEEWSDKSVKEDPEYEKMSVRVGLKSREINVSYIVDEQTMAIRVVLPEAYPLASAEVISVSRVAVKEEKWQSWLRNCQGVITFSVSLHKSSHRRANLLTASRRTAASLTASPPGART